MCLLSILDANATKFRANLKFEKVPHMLVENLMIGSQNNIMSFVDMSEDAEDLSPVTPNTTSVRTPLPVWATQTSTVSSVTTNTTNPSKKEDANSVIVGFN